MSCKCADSIFGRSIVYVSDDEIWYRCRRCGKKESLNSTSWMPSHEKDGIAAAKRRALAKPSIVDKLLGCLFRIPYQIYFPLGLNSQNHAFIFFVQFSHMMFTPVIICKLFPSLDIVYVWGIWFWLGMPITGVFKVISDHFFEKNPSESIADCY